MGHPHYSKEEIVRRGEELYEQQIRGQIDEERNKGKALVIDIETGDYEIDEDGLAAARPGQASRRRSLCHADRLPGVCQDRWGLGSCETVIAGTVLPTREAVVQLELVGTGGLRTSVQALIDRGFTGYLALPLHLVGALGLPYLQTDRVFLAARG
jgi:hypothetical protein